MELSCGVVCVILRLAVLIQYRSVTDTQTDTRRRHIPRLARRRAVKRTLTRRYFVDRCVTFVDAKLQGTATFINKRGKPINFCHHLVCHRRIISSSHHRRRRYDETFEFHRVGRRLQCELNRPQSATMSDSLQLGQRQMTGVCHFSTNLVAKATSLEISEKEARVEHMHPKRFHSMKRLRKSVQ